MVGIASLSIVILIYQTLGARLSGLEDIFPRRHSSLAASNSSNASSSASSLLSTSSDLHQAFPVRRALSAAAPAFSVRAPRAHPIFRGKFQVIPDAVLAAGKGNEFGTFDVHDKNFKVSVDLPSTWANLFDAGAGGRLIRTTAHGKWSTMIFKANLLQDGTEVVFKVMNALDPRAIREVHMRQRLAMIQSTGWISRRGIIPCYGTREVNGATVLLMAAADGDLKELITGAIWEAARSSPPNDGSPRYLVPLNISLPILVDLLHGAKNLAEAGIIDGDVCDTNVLLKDGRAFITDFGFSKLAHDGDEGFGTESLQEGEGTFVGSAYHHAPEMVDGTPTGPETMIWGIGLLATQMLLGTKVSAQLDSAGDAINFDREFSARKGIRKKIREKFSVESIRGFQDMPSDVKTFLSGMLEKDNHKRLTADEGIRLAEQIAKKRDITLPGEPDVRAWKFSSEWF